MTISRRFTTLFMYACLSLAVSITGCGGGEGASSDSNGKGGSMARFSLIGDYLYTIAGSKLQLFYIANDPSNISVFANIEVDRNIETLFSANNHLFIGATNGVHIYEHSQPSSPTKVSSLLHVTSCDPVVVSGQYAYVTLRSGSGICRQGENRMDVIDISNIEAPVLVKSYPMRNPTGLGVENNLLFVCDANAGMKIFNLDNPAEPLFTRSETSLNCYDLIPNNHKLVVSDKSGIVQYRYNALQLSKLSHITAE